MPGRRALAAVVAVTALAAEREQSVAAAQVVVSYPGPGWRVASPHTSITFTGADAGEHRGDRVGQRAAHRAGVHALRSEPGSVFTPDRRFGTASR